MLTKEQEEEARRLYIESKLTDAEKFHATQLKLAKAEMDIAKRKFEELQKACPHPLIARETENAGTSGNWDRYEAYWTRHKCALCGKVWTTNQSWKQVGGKMGMPDDPEAKEH